MSPKEASDKLGHYADKFGAWVHDLTPEDARAMAANRREQFGWMGGGAAHLHLLCDAVQFGAVAECLEILAETP
jgi:hypothetical protein